MKPGDLVRLAKLIKLSGETVKLFSSPDVGANGQSSRIRQLSDTVELAADELLGIAEGAEEEWDAPLGSDSEPSMGTGHAMTDLHGNFVGADQRYCTMLGYRPEQLFGLTIMGITYEEDHRANRDLLERLKRTGEAFMIRKRYRRRDGALIWVENEVSQLKVRDGQDRIFATSRMLDE